MPLTGKHTASSFYPKGGCRQGIEPDRKEHPSDRGTIGQSTGCPPFEAAPRITPGGQPTQRMQRVSRSGENCKRGGGKYCRPLPPMVNLFQIIGPHQPNKFGAWKSFVQCRQCIGSIARADPGFEIGDFDLAVTGDSFGIAQSHRKRGHTARGFQRILRRDKPPNLVQIQTLQGFEADVTMTPMGRVERSPQKTDLAGTPIGDGGGKGQGRVHGMNCGRDQGRT